MRERCECGTVLDPDDGFCRVCMTSDRTTDGEPEAMHRLDVRCVVCNREWLALYPLDLSPETKGLECPGCGYMTPIRPATSAIDECDCGHLRAAHGPDIRDHDTTEGACRVPTCPCLDFYHNRDANG